MGNEKPRNLIIDNNNKLNSIAMGCWIASGSFNDYQNKSGLHHFLEHLIFNIPYVKEKSNLLKEKGAVINAFTSQELMCFYVNCLEEHYDLALDFMESIIYSDLEFDENVNFDNEKKIIMREIEYHDKEIEQVKNRILKQIFYENKYSLSILGDINTISNIDLLDIKSLYKQIQTNVDKFITIVGNVNNKKYNLNLTNMNDNKDISIEIKDNYFIDALETDSEYCYYGIAKFYPKKYRKEGRICSECIKEDLLNSIREVKGIVYRVNSTNMNFNFGMVSFWILKIHKKNIDFVKGETKKIVENIDFNYLEKLQKTKTKIITKNIIKNDNTLSKMLSLGYGNTILKDEENEYDFLGFINNEGGRKYFQQIIDFR